MLACTGGHQDLDVDRLERVEDLTEELANDLLTFSVAVRDDDGETIKRFLDDSLVASPLPATAPPAKPLIKWIDKIPLGDP